MSWRYQLPAMSPVAPAALISGIVAAATRSGAAVDAIAEQLKERYNAQHVVLTDSGTSALVAALRVLMPAGGTVAYPGYACIDLTAAAVSACVRVRLYDVDPLTLSPNIDSLRRTIERGVDAIVVAHLYGYPADVRAVKTLAAEYAIPVIEDAAQAAGGTLADVRLGSFGDISVLSFGRGKGTTAGSGGALIIRSRLHTAAARAEQARLASHTRGVRDVAALAAQWMFGRPELYRIPASIPALKLGEMVYHRHAGPRPMSSAAAAMLPSALNMEASELSHRRTCAGEIMNAVLLTGGRLSPVRAVAGGRPGFLRLAFLDTTGEMRPHEALGVMRGYPQTLAEHFQLRPILAAGEQAGTGAERLRDRLFTAATHSRVRASDLHRFRDWAAQVGTSQAFEAFAT